MAQSGTSSALGGTVSDRSGAVLPNAAVTAVETDTHAARSGVTNVTATAAPTSSRSR